MSEVAICPTCGSKSRIEEKEGERVYTALQDEEVIKKVGQLK